MKAIITQQVKILYHYKSTKKKLPKAKAAVWFNKLCRIQHLTPKYTQIKEVSAP